jgi:hypothetical protein
VTGQGSAAGASLVDHIVIVPATLTMKYHLPLGPIKPYIGAGPALFIVLDDRPGDTARALGVTNTKLSSQVGVALQAGVDIPLGKRLRSDEELGEHHRFYAGNAEVLTTKHKLDHVVRAGRSSFNRRGAAAFPQTLRRLLVGVKMDQPKRLAGRVQCFGQRAAIGTTAARGGGHPSALSG